MTDRTATGRGPHPGPRPGSRVRPAHVATAAVFSRRGVDGHHARQRPRQLLARRRSAGRSSRRHTLDALGVAWLGVPAAPWRTLPVALRGRHVRRRRPLSAGRHCVALRLLTAAALFAVLALTLVRRRQPLASFLVVLGVVVGIEALLQDRPATVSLVFVALLGAACERLWVTGRRPSPLAVGRRMPAVGPAARPVGARARGVRRRRARGTARPRPRAHRSAARCPACAALLRLAGLVNPQGAGSFLLPVRFQQAAGTQIVEWSPDDLHHHLDASLGVFLVLFLIFAWVRSPGSRTHHRAAVVAARGRFSG